MSTMKRRRDLAARLALAATLILSLPAAAQNIDGLPRPSPHAAVSQTIGITEVTIDYHRPAVNGRTVWGGLVPYGAVWRAGANDNTTIHFSHPVKVEGKDLAAGTYGLHMLPTEDTWTIIFSNDSTSWGSFAYDEKEDALRVTVRPEEAPFEEWLRYGFDDLANDSATVALYWEELKVPFAVEVDTHAAVLTHLRQELRHLPGFSWQGWNSAAAYCAQNGINLEEALTWADRSIAIEENATNLLTKAAVLDQLDRSTEAEELRTKALAMANEAQVNLMGYQALNRGDVDHAIELFKRNVANYPESWNTYDSLAEAYRNKGETELSVEFYSKALEMAPEAQKPRIQAILDDLKK